jgi:flagellar hook-associated protein 1 FlgK
MAGLNGIMDSSLSALLAAQLGMATTSHNISNSATRGYSRQDMILAARRPSVLGYGSLGTGVEVMGIRRIQDQLLLGNLRNQNARLGSFDVMDQTLREIEGLLGSVDNDHLGNALSNFFASWNDLAQPPFNESLKVGVVQSAETLVEEFHNMDSALRDLERDLAARVAAEVQELNRLLEEVGELNGQIILAEAGGGSANDLRDRRDLVINNISSIAAITTRERDDGSLDLVMAGRTMVSRDRVTLFEDSVLVQGSGFTVGVVTAGNQQQVSLSPGRLEGLLTSQRDHVASLRNQLDDVAAQLVDQVNEWHTLGQTAGGGRVFFTGSTLADIAVNEALVSDPNLVATGRSGLSGDNELALAIAALGDNAPGRISVGEAYRGVITEVAGNSGNVAFLMESQEGVVASLEARMASISGVSLDEEGARLVQYQNSYNAAAKVIQTVQEMYDTLLGMI